MSAIHTILKQATLAPHQRLHDHPLLSPLASGHIDKAQYATTLAGYHRFYTALSEKLSDAGYDSPQLEKDIRRLHRDTTFMQDYTPSLPAPTMPWTITHKDEWYGLHYVTEGSHLGGLYIAKQVTNTLGLTKDAGLAYFYGDGKRTMPQWKIFLDGLESNVNDITRCSTAASQVFNDLEAYLWRVHRHVTAIPNDQSLKRAVS